MAIVFDEIVGTVESPTPPTPERPSVPTPSAPELEDEALRQRLTRIARREARLEAD